MSLTAKEVAKMLSLDERTVYALAAPDGPLPCYRFGRSVRFEAEDVREYKERCRSTTTKPERAGGGSSKRTLMASAIDLASSFRAAGLKVKPESMTSRKPRAPTLLCLPGKE